MTLRPLGAAPAGHCRAARVREEMVSPSGGHEMIERRDIARAPVCVVLRNGGSILSGRGESNPPFLAWEASVLTIGQRPRVGGSLLPRTTLQDVRARVYWPVMIAAAALVALLTYGVASNGRTPRSTSSCRGERVEAPVKTCPCSARGHRLAGRPRRQGGRPQRVGLVVSAVQVRDAAAPDARRISPPTAGSCSASTPRTRRRRAGVPREGDRVHQPARPRPRVRPRARRERLPETFLIDREGRIAAIRRGPGRPGLARRAPDPAAGGAHEAAPRAGAALGLTAAAEPRRRCPTSRTR